MHRHISNLRQVSVYRGLGMGERSAAFTPLPLGTLCVALRIFPTAGKGSTVKRPEGRAPGALGWGATKQILRQSRRHERMNGSKPYDASADQQTSGEVTTRFAQRVSTFPSPWPSPSYVFLPRTKEGPGARDLSRRNACTTGPRGRISRPLRYPTSLRTEVRAPFARHGNAKHIPWERVRVRGIGLPFDTATRLIHEIVELHESSGRAGGFPRR